MYLDSIYNNDAYFPNWKLLNIVAGRGAGKSYFCRQLAETLTVCGDTSVAIIFEDKSKLDFICGEYFSDWQRNEKEFYITKSNKRIYVYPQKDGCFMEDNFDLVIIDDALEIKTKRLEQYLWKLKAGLFKKVIANFHHKKCKQSQTLLWHEEAHNLFLYNKDYISQLNCPKFINLFTNRFKEKS